MTIKLIFREIAAETIYKERCTAVNDGSGWAKYMSISGSDEDEHDIITLQYTEEGLLSIDENRDGHAAAFGDDIALECLATEFKREVYVVCDIFSHSCLFFLIVWPILYSLVGNIIEMTTVKLMLFLFILTKQE